MMRTIAASLIALIAACGLCVSTAGSASALGGETMTCRVSPGRVLQYYPHCQNSTGQSSYQVTFAVENETGSPTHAWSISAPFSWSVANGCTSAAAICVINVTSTEEDITATATLTQDGATETLTSTASIRQYCGNINCA